MGTKVQIDGELFDIRGIVPNVPLSTIKQASSSSCSWLPVKLRRRTPKLPRRPQDRDLFPSGLPRVSSMRSCQLGAAPLGTR